MQASCFQMHLTSIYKTLQLYCSAADITSSWNSPTPSILVAVSPQAQQQIITQNSSLWQDASPYMFYRRPVLQALPPSFPQSLSTQQRFQPRLHQPSQSQLQPHPAQPQPQPYSQPHPHPHPHPHSHSHQQPPPVHTPNVTVESHFPAGHCATCTCYERDSVLRFLTRSECSAYASTSDHPVDSTADGDETFRGSTSHIVGYSPAEAGGWAYEYEMFRDSQFNAPDASS